MEGNAGPGEAEESATALPHSLDWPNGPLIDSQGTARTGWDLPAQHPGQRHHLPSRHRPASLAKALEEKPERKEHICFMSLLPVGCTQTALLGRQHIWSQLPTLESSPLSWEDPLSVPRLERPLI